jgi:hypothetical protein
LVRLFGQLDLSERINATQAKAALYSGSIASFSKRSNLENEEKNDETEANTSTTTETSATWNLSDVNKEVDAIDKELSEIKFIHPISSKATRLL